MRISARYGAGILLALLTTAGLAADYFPARGTWEERTPSQVGMSAERLQAAIDFAIANEATDPRDLGLRHEMTFGREPHGAGGRPVPDPCAGNRRCCAQRLPHCGVG